MSRSTDIRCVGASLYLLPVQTRVPLKFGSETLAHVTCARVRITVQDRSGRRAEGWGETPLSVQWAWPGAAAYAYRYERMVELCRRLTRAWADFAEWGHPIEVGHAFTDVRLAEATADQNRQAENEPLPRLAALICCSAFDIALHDAFGRLHGRSIYELYGQPWMAGDLSRFLAPAAGSSVRFDGRFLSDDLAGEPPSQLPAWHLVGGLDPIDEADLTGTEPQDGYPVLLRDWIRRDGLTCLKIKLRGNDIAWDYARIVRVGRVALELIAAPQLSADFNCTVREPEYVNDILDRLVSDEPSVFERILYVEQPFPYDLEAHPIDVHSVSRRRPLLLDESAHDWKLVRLGRELGWTGAALKTCKTQTGALLTACWAKAHGMSLMVQDLTNPMLAMIPHVQLAARVGTIAGVEVNAMQFYPDASRPEEAVHPGLYRRRGGQLDLSSIRGPGFGYRVDEIRRELPEPIVCV